MSIRRSYYYNVYAYYYLSPCPVSGVLGDGGFYDCSTDQWNNYETCDAVCETVLPGPHTATAATRNLLRSTPGSGILESPLNLKDSTSIGFPESCMGLFLSNCKHQLAALLGTAYRFVAGGIAKSLPPRRGRVRGEG